MNVLGKRARKETPAKKEKPEKRQDATGRTIPISRHPNQKVQERMERAMPGASASDVDLPGGNTKTYICPMSIFGLLGVLHDHNAYEFELRTSVCVTLRERPSHVRAEPTHCSAIGCCKWSHRRVWNTRGHRCRLLNFYCDYACLPSATRH